MTHPESFQSPTIDYKNRDVDYPIIDVEAENDHFRMSDSVMSWIERCRSSNAIVGELFKNDTVEMSTADHLCDALSFPPGYQHQLSASNLAWNLVKMFSEKQGLVDESISKIFASPQPDLGISSLDPRNSNSLVKSTPSPSINSAQFDNSSNAQTNTDSDVSNTNHAVRVRGNDEWAPPRPQIIFNIHEETNFRKLMQRQNYRCSGCGIKIDLDMARRLVLYCHYLGKYFCKCCFSHKSIHLPGYILQKWDFHKYPISQYALQLLDRIANEPLFNVNDINPSLYRRVKKLRLLVDIRLQLYYLKIYITTCTQTEKLSNEYSAFTQQHLLQDDIHVYSLNNLIEIQHGKLYEYLNDLVARSIAHIAQCDRCRAKGHYCQLCGPSSLISSLLSVGNGPSNTENTTDQSELHEYQIAKLKPSKSIEQGISSLSIATNKTIPENQQQVQTGPQHTRSSSGTHPSFVAIQPSASGTTIQSTSIDNHELIFPFEIGRVAQCRACGCCFHLKCFIDAGQNCPKCQRIQRRKAETKLEIGTNGGNNADSCSHNPVAAPSEKNVDRSKIAFE